MIFQVEKGLFLRGINLKNPDTHLLSGSDTDPLPTVISGVTVVGKSPNHVFLASTGPDLLKNI